MALSYLIADPSNHFLFALPFVLSGVIKIIYDVRLALRRLRLLAFASFACGALCSLSDFIVAYLQRLLLRGFTWGFQVRRGVCVTSTVHSSSHFRCRFSLETQIELRSTLTFAC